MATEESIGVTSFFLIFKVYGNAHYKYGRDRFESTASAGTRIPSASPIDLPPPIPEDPLPSSAKGGGRR